MYTYFVAFKLLSNENKLSYHSDIISTKEPVTTEKRLRYVEGRLAKKWAPDGLPFSEITSRIQSITLMNPK